jgi:hypothetical protein
MAVITPTDNWRYFQDDERVNYCPPPDGYDTPDELESRLVDSMSGTILRRDAGDCILRHDECAVAFLRLIAQGRLNLAGQEYFVRILRELHASCFGKRHRSAGLKVELIKTLDILSANAVDFFQRHGYECSTNKELLGELECNYSFYYSFHHALSVARSAAMAAFTKAFAERFAASEHPADLVGEWHFEASADVFDDLKDNLVGIYEKNICIRIEKVPRKRRLILKFIHFPPLSESWYTLEEVAYRAAAPILSLALGTTVTPVGTLSN